MAACSSWTTRAPSGTCSSMGPKTPIWVPLERVRDELQRRGFLHVADFEAGTGVALLASPRQSDFTSWTHPALSARDGSEGTCIAVVESLRSICCINNGGL